MLEESLNGWVIKHGRLDHNPKHPVNAPPPLTDADKKCTYTKNRKIPDQLLDTVTPAVHRLAKTVSAIHAHLETEAKEKGITVTFTYQDTANTFAVTHAERLHDCTGMMSLLNERLAQGLFKSEEIDADGRLQNVFFEMVRLPRARARYELLPIL